MLLLIIVIILLLLIPGLTWGPWPAPARPGYVAPAGFLLTLVLAVLLIALLFGVW